MYNWVNYKGEVLQPPFSFMSAESVAQSRDFDFENLSFTIRVFSQLETYTITWMLGEILVHLLKLLAGERMVLIFKSTVEILRFNFNADEPPMMYFPSLWVIRWSQQVAFSSITCLISRLITLYFWTLCLWIVAYSCINVQRLFLLKLLLNCVSTVLFTMFNRYEIYNYWTTVCKTYQFVHWYW